MDACGADADKHGVKLIAKRNKLLQSELCETREDAAPVPKKVQKPGKATSDPIHGLFVGAGLKPAPTVVEY
jgi:type I restriction enzyme M protein